MKFKSISSLLTAMLLSSSCYINSFAGAVSKDSRYEIIEGSTLTANDILEEDVLDVEVKGSTLVNLFEEDTSNWKDVTQYNSGMLYLGRANLFKPGKQYTIFCEFSDIVGESKVCFNFNSGRQKPDIFLTPKKGKVRHTFTMPSDYPILDTSYVYVYYFDYGNSCKIRNVMILEGDLLLEDMPQYIKNVESSFENTLVTQDMVDSGLEDRKNLGKYKVEYTFNNSQKNLFNKNTAKKVYIDGNIYTGLIIDTASGLNRSSDWIPCKPNTFYTVSGGQRSRWVLRNKDGDMTYIGTSEGNDNSTIKTLDDTVEFMCYVIYDNLNYLNTVQIEEGSKATEYEEFKELSKTFYLNEPLRAVNDDVKDRIIKKDGKWVVERNCGQTILDGNEYWWQLSGDSNGNYSRFRYDGFRGKMGYLGYIKCNRFYSYKDDSSFTIDYEGICDRANGSGFNIHINNYRLESVDVDGFKKWLSENPITIVYKLDNAIYESLDVDLSFELKQGINHIYTNSNIPTNIKIELDRKMNRAIEAIKTAKSNPTLNNISIARMWLNLLDESIAKDDLQSDIDNITEIVDLTIDKKKVSANLDLYVKSENALSMSLNTNSVTFENYNNTEDMEKLGAVNITVSSSLPYDLNAYMPNGISNLDGTKTMDSNLLNIRDDSTSTYKPFIGIDTKVILKEDCNAGNNNLHTIDFKLNGSQSHDADIYRTVIKFEAQQK